MHWDSLCDIVDLLIQALGEKETVIRESAAKGLGRLTSRMTQDMAMDVLHYVLALPPTSVNLHSMALTLSEMTGRKLLAPEFIRLRND